MPWHNAHLIAHAFVGLGSHKAILPPAPAVVIIPHISVDTLLGLTLKAKYSPTELGAGGIPLVARGNDSGYFVPHFSIPMNNVLLPLTIALGGSKVLFGSSTVLINAGGAQHCGCCTFPVVPMSLNMACNDPCSYPGDIVVAPNTVEVFMTPGDIIMGVVSAVIDTAVSFGLGKLAGGISGAVTNAVCRRIAQRHFWEFASDFSAETARSMCRDVGENIAERFGERLVGRYVDGIMSEAIKVGLVEPVVDAMLGAALGDGTNRDSAYDSAGTGAAGLFDQGPGSAPRAYDTNGPGVRVGGI